MSVLLAPDSTKSTEIPGTRKHSWRICKKFNTQRISQYLVTRQDIKILKRVIILLEPFEYLTREVSGENCLTVYKGISMINCLSTTLRKFTSPYAEIFRSDLNRRFGKIEYNSHTALITIQDPRFQNINF